MTLTATQRRVREKCTAVYSATILDENGVAIPLSSLTALTLTLYDYNTGTKINSRNHQDILNANNVTVTSVGLLTWTMQPSDNAIIGTTAIGSYERHTALFEWTWSSGTKAGRYEVRIDVQNLAEVT